MKKTILRKVIFITILFLIISIREVNAQTDEYYENDNGVIVSKKEYQFINDFYGENYFLNMDLVDYEWIEDLNIDNSELEIKRVYDFNHSSRATAITQYGKSLTIAKSCSSNCVIIVNCQWNILPSIRSYDVIGARFSGTTLVSDTINTKLTSSNGTEYFNSVQRFTSGFGVSVKLPTGSNISIEQKYTVARDGTVYASYQHSQSNISLATSKLYTINSTGYGSVFKFYGNASGVYDEMEGVYIST